MTFDRNQLPDPSEYFADQGLNLGGPRSAKWKTTRCPFHGGSDSMRVQVHTGGWCCMNCGAKGGDVLSFEMQLTGADFVTAAKALGAWIDDGRALPPTAKPSTLSVRQAISVIGFEATLAAVAAGNVAHGVTLTDTDRRRLLVAARRITHLVEVYT